MSNFIQQAAELMYWQASGLAWLVPGRVASRKVIGTTVKSECASVCVARGSGSIGVTC